MATFTPTELFGGAMSAQLPASWQDMNDLGHPVPDNQEVWCERAGGEGGSLVIEIVERADVDDAAAPAYFFDDIADASGASARELVAAGPAAAAAMDGVACVVALGHMKLAKTGVVGPDHGVDVAVAAFRFPAEATDVLATLNAPALGGTRLAPKPVDELLASPALAPLRDVLRTLVVDRGLFS
jgi:hypothetical protein